MQKFFLLLALCLFGCGASDSTALMQPTSSADVGTIRQPLIKKVFDDKVPVTESFDFNTATQLDWEGPFWVSLFAWVEVEDVAAGFLLFDIHYVDPTGADRTMNFDMTTNLNLADPDQIFSTPVIGMVRQSGSSAWTLETTLAGSAGDSLVHYEILVSPHEAANVQEFSN